MPGSLVLSVVASLRGGDRWVVARFLGILPSGRTRSLRPQVSFWKCELLSKKASLVSEPFLRPFLPHDSLLPVQALTMM